jgi:hypothetical protein
MIDAIPPPHVYDTAKRRKVLSPCFEVSLSWYSPYRCSGWRKWFADYQYSTCNDEGASVLIEVSLLGFGIGITAGIYSNREVQRE